jgi:hypothetical protein
VEYLVFVAVCTTAIAALAFVAWRRKRDSSILVGIGLLYYFSLHGSWSIIVDRIGGDSGKAYGYLELKLFPIHLDQYYFESLALYAGFVILVELALIGALRPSSRAAQPDAIVVSPTVILLLSFGAAIASMLIISGPIHDAAAAGTSVYVQTRGVQGDVPDYFTIHQILNRAALMPSALGLAILFSGPEPRFITLSRRDHWIIFGHVALIAMMIGFCLLLGNKNELLQAGLAGTLFYLVNCPRPRYGWLLGLGAVGGTVLGLVDVLRSLPFDESVAAAAQLDFESLQMATEFVTSSNEAFAAHFSMYGALSHQVPLTYGSSVVSLLASVIPRVLWSDRPPDIYAYYAQSVDALEGQAYTVHHATGWYLNFGIAGVVAGALLLGWTWAYCHNAATTASAAGTWRQIIRVLGPSLFVAALPSFLRAGPEAYKALFVEGLLLPTVILALAAPRSKVASGGAVPC